MDNNTNNWKEFTLGNPQEEKPRRVAERRRRPLRVLLAVAAVLAGIVTAAVLLDRSGFDGLRRSIIYAKAVKDENGCAQLYRYNSDQSGHFASLDGSLVSVSCLLYTSGVGRGRAPPSPRRRTRRAPAPVRRTGSSC